MHMYMYLSKYVYYIYIYDKHICMCMYVSSDKNNCIHLHVQLRIFPNLCVVYVGVRVWVFKSLFMSDWFRI